MKLVEEKVKAEGKPDENMAGETENASETAETVESAIAEETTAVKSSIVAEKPKKPIGLIISTAVCLAAAVTFAAMFFTVKTQASAEISSISAEKDALVAEKEETEAKLTSAETEAKSYKDAYDELSETYTELKAETEPYLNLSEEARAYLVETAEEEAQKKAEEEEAARLAEEAKGYDTGITYEQLARTPDDYVFKKVKFKGYVLQNMEFDGGYALRVATSGKYDDVIYVTYYTTDDDTTRILEDDYVEILGVGFGLKSYEAVSGKTVTLPSIMANYVNLLQ